MSREKITFGSVCSGIEAASVAWHPLGWESAWFAEIEPFPAAVLKHHYPDTPNYGDMTKLPEMVLGGEIDAPDVLVGGTPCQSFSVAGMRKGLSDDRGQLTIKFVELANAIDHIRQSSNRPESIIIWENVPGVLNTKDNAFGCFLGALSGAGEALNPNGGSKGNRWTNAGYVLGSKRAVAWRVLDAQYFGVAQRRRRVFVVASARDGFCPAQVLFEFDGVRRDIAPSREQGQKTTGNVGAGAYKSDGWPAEIASTLNASFGSKLGLENQHIDGGAPLFVPDKVYSFDSLASNSMKSMNPNSGCREVDLAKTLDTTIPCPSKNQGGLGVVGQAFGIPGNWIGRKPENGGNATQFMHEVAPTQTATDKHGVIAFNSRQDPVSGDVFGALDTCSPQAQAIAYGCTPTKLNGVANTITASYGQGGVDLETKPLALVTNNYKEPNAVAIAGTQNDAFRDATNNLAPTLRSGSGGGVVNQAVATTTAVRRLTPVECERLQGFPDGYTAIPWRGKPSDDCPDGHRYKALGNSMAVTVMRWIGSRVHKELMQ